MKKLVLLAAFGVAGMMSANNSVLPKLDENLISLNEFTQNEGEIIESHSLIVPPDHAWIGVQTWCGKVFYLDLNHYTSREELDAAADHFTDAQCGKQSTGIQPGMV